MHREDNDRVVRRVDLAVGGGRRQVLRQLAAGGVDGRLDVPRRRIDVTVELELQRDLCARQHAGRGHLRHARDLRELRLERLRHRGGHDLRARARQVRRHQDGGEVHLRERRDRQEREGDETDEHSPAISSVVAIGRSMKGREMFTARARRSARPTWPPRGR